MNIDDAKELRRKAESDITRILHELLAKVQPSRLDMRVETESFVDTSEKYWEQRVASIAVRIHLEI